ncbi:MAG: hypothetical protein NT033_06785 [Candidatus Omnitrophica bacterium]|nr:hypothetical protein [Candidatus Omnitrophota bacterium]
MKKTLFPIILFLLNIAILLIVTVCFLRSYSILIYRKHSKPEFVKLIEDLKIKGIDKNYELPELSDSRGFDPRKPHPYCGFKTQAAVRFGENDYINALGHRSPTLAQKEKGVFRIALIGGSAAFAGATMGQTIIAMLADLFMKHGVKVEYINAAVVSAISNQELSILVHDLIDLKVDVLISYDGYNDIISPLYYNGRIGWPPFRWDPPLDHPYPDQVKQLAPSYYPRINPTGGNMNSEKILQITNNYLNNIDKIATICKAFNIQYMAILQPLKDFSRNKCQTNEKLMPVDLFYCEIQSVFEQWDSEKKMNASYISLADYLKDKRDVFTDESHINDRGNALVARIIFEIINARKILKRNNGQI